MQGILTKLYERSRGFNLMGRIRVLVRVSVKVKFRVMIRIRVR